MTQQEFDTQMAAINNESREKKMDFFIEEQDANRQKHKAIQDAYDAFADSMRSIRARRDEFNQSIIERKLELKRQLAESINQQ